MLRVTLLIAFLCSIFISSSAIAGRSILVVNDLSPSKKVSAEDAQVITDLLRGQMVKSGRFTVVERTEMEKIAEEIEFQMSDCTDVSCAVEFGQMLNADKMVVGTVAEFMGQMIITARIVDLAKAEVEFEERASAKADPISLQKAVDELGMKLSEHIPLVVSVISIEGESYWLDAGSRDGIFKTQRLQMLREKIIRDSKGKALGRADEPAGELKVSYVSPGTTKAMRTGGDIRKGDYTRISSARTKTNTAVPDAGIQDDELAKLRAELEAKRRAIEERELEIQKAAEAKRKAKEAEIARLKAQLEETGKTISTTLAKSSRQADTSSLDYDLEKLRLELEAKKKAEEENKRLRQQEAEARRKAKEAELARLKKQLDEAEKASGSKRGASGSLLVPSVLDADLEKLRVELEAKRKIIEENEKARQREAEAVRKAKEAEIARVKTQLEEAEKLARASQNKGGATYTDPKTGLMWQREDDGKSRIWDDSEFYCSNLILGGYSDWRLPKRDELETLVEKNRKDPAIDISNFPNTKSINGYWTSSVGQLINFFEGSLERHYAGYGGSPPYTRCVRQGPAGHSSENIYERKTASDATHTNPKTGLMWQREDDGIKRESRAEAIEYCQDLKLGGYSDWRLPTRDEQYSIVDKSFGSPVIDLKIFPNTKRHCYWSYTNPGLGVDFNDGYSYDSWSTVDSKCYARCVRKVDPPISPEMEYGKFVSSSETYTDPKTGLTWQREDDGNEREWTQADGYCRNLVIGGYDNWRMPKKDELLSIVDKTSKAPAINKHYFPNTKPKKYWTSSSMSSHAESAFYVDFTNGDLDYDNVMNELGYIRCVR